VRGEANHPRARRRRGRLRPLGFGLILGLGAALALGACPSGGARDAPEGRHAVDAAVPALPPPPPPQVIFHTAKGDVPVRVEVAATERARRRGLMFRDHLDPGRGMLFVFDRPGVRTFWMHNTLIPLDMVFLDAKLRVVGVVARAAPRTDTPRGVGVPSQFVVEVPGGWAAAHGVEPGVTARLVSVLRP